MRAKRKRDQLKFNKFPLRFPGQYFDEETGLHYNWHRYYDPETGRYITPDPIGLRGGLNLYLYSEADPVNKIDPMGLMSGCDAIFTFAPLPIWAAPFGDALCGGSPTSSLYPIDCNLAFSTDNGDGKSCFYECGDALNGWRVVTVGECDSCPSTMRYDRNSYGPPVPTTFQN